MESILLLRHPTGHQRTLIITCPECRKYLKEEELTATFFCIGGMLRRHDHLQQDCIRHHLEVNHCVRIVIAGHHCCKIVKRIHDDHAHNISSPYMLEWKTDALLRGHSRQFLRKKVRDKMITELNVLEQLQVLSGFQFVKSRLKNGTLDISGIVIDELHSSVTEIFRNGVVFNDLISGN